MSDPTRFRWRDGIGQLPGPNGERFTDDLVVWVMFYGPEGGEAV